MQSRPLGLLVSVAAAVLFMGALLLEEVKGEPKLTDCTSQNCTPFFVDDYPKTFRQCVKRKTTDGITLICTFSTVNAKGKDIDKPIKPGSECKKAAKDSTCDKLCHQDENTVYYDWCLTKEQGWECTPKGSESTKFCGCSRLADENKVKKGQKDGEKCG